MEELETPFDRGEYLQNLLISQATGGSADNSHYQLLRREFMNDLNAKQYVPQFIRTNRDLGQFWQFIKFKFAHYSERREFLWAELNPLLEHLESVDRAPADQTITETLRQLNESGVQAVWHKAIERRVNDPEGAITSARTLLESTCKHILDELEISYNPNSMELHELYKLVAGELDLSPDQHNEKVFKQILGGCSGVVSGLGTLRNRLGDAHGKGALPVKPAPRHAELAVNLAGSVSMFLISTYKARE